VNQSSAPANPMSYPTPPPNLPPHQPSIFVPPTAHARDSSQPFVAPGSIPGSSSAAGLRQSSPMATSSTGRTRPIQTPPTPEQGSSADRDDAAYFDRHGPRADSPLRRSSPRDIPVRAPAASVKENLNERYGERTREDSLGRRPTPTRVMSNDDETVVEKMWQSLFDADGNPTLRMNQFLRGIALYLVLIYILDAFRFLIIL
jgi:hypothetical protein